MSNFTRAAYHPKEKVVRAAIYLDDHFGQHEFGVMFSGDPHVYKPRETDIPLDVVFAPRDAKAEPDDDKAPLPWLKRARKNIAKALADPKVKAAIDKQRRRAVKTRSQIKNPLTGTWTKRDEKSGKFLNVKMDAKPFKGVRRAK